MACGLQFRTDFLKATAPTTVEGIEKYLGSGAAVGAFLYAVFGFMAVSAPAALVAAMAVLVSVMVLFERRIRTPGGSNSPR
jgi:hypothetical protein